MTPGAESRRFGLKTPLSIGRLPALGRRKWLALAPVVAVLAVACSTNNNSPSSDSTSADPATIAMAAPETVTPAGTATPVGPAAPSVGAPAPAVGGLVDPAAAPEATTEPTPDPGAAVLAAFAGRQRRSGWQTDFTLVAEGIDVREIFSGGVPRDGIPSLDSPEFAAVADAPDYLRPDEPVIVLELNGVARAYPLSILTWHEIVNDIVGGEPVVVTFCPLCNTSLAFPRTVNGRVLEFGVSGSLRNSDLVMYDRQTQSWWQQATGQGIIGEFAGTRLEFLPVVITGWEAFAQQFPDGEVLLRPTDISIARNYSRPPYAGYDNINESPFLFSGPFDGRLKPMQRVATLAIDNTQVAYPFDFLQENPVINDTVGGAPVTVFFDDETNSAFRTVSGDFAASGSTTIFDRRAGERTLTFSISTDGAITDSQTGSVWNRFGEATAGELAGTRLSPVVHAAHFWFAWAAFSPDTVVRGTLEQLTG